MKNLKINNERFKRLISGGLAVVLAGSLTGCSLNNDSKDKTTSNNKKLETVIAGNKVISVADLKLKDTETNKVLENEEIEAILVGNKLEREFDLIEIIFNSSVDSILINDELVSVDRLALVNSKTNEDIKAIDYALVADELIPIKDYVNGDTSNKTVDIEINCEDKVEEVEYEELTTEKFEKITADVYKKYSEIGLDVSEKEIIDYMMVVNIDRLAVDNKELITNIIGERSVDEVILNMYNVYSSIMTENNNRYCARGLGWDSIITVSDTVFDAREKEIVISIENRIKEIVETKDNKEFNKLLNTLLMEMLNATDEEFNMESGTGYSVMTILINFVRRNFVLDTVNSELIKYFVSYAEDAVEYQQNSRTTAYYSGIYNLITDCPSYVKTK